MSATSRQPVRQTTRSRLFKLTEAHKYGLRTAVAMVLAAYVAVLLHLQAPYWSVISVIMVMNPYIGMTTNKVIQRIIATILGAVFGLIITSVMTINLPMLLAIAFLAIAISQYFILTTDSPYVFLLGGLSFMLVVGSTPSGAEQPFFVAIWRCSEILVGAAAAVASVYLVFSPQIKQTIFKEIGATQDALADVLALLNRSHQTAEANQVLIKLKAALLQAVDKVASLAKDPERSDVNYQALSDIAHYQQRLLGLIENNRKMFEALATFTWLGELKLDYRLVVEALVAYTRTLHLHVTSKKVLSQREDCIQALAAFNANFEATRKTTKFQDYPLHETILVHHFVDFVEQMLSTLALIATQLSIVLDSEQRPRQDDAPLVRFTRDKHVIRHCIKAGFSMDLALYGWLLSAWPGGFQGIISSLVIAQQKFIREAQRMSWLRMLGCCIGGGVGLFFLHFMIYNIADLLVFVFVFGWIFAYYSYKSKKYSYAALQANLAFAITMVQSGGPTHSLSPSLGRLSGIFLGVGSTLLINYLFWPLYPHEVVNKLLRRLRYRLAKLSAKLFRFKSTKPEHKLQAYESLMAQFDEAKQLLAIEDNETQQAYLTQYRRMANSLVNIAERIDLDGLQKTARTLGIDLEPTNRDAWLLVQQSLQLNSKLKMSQQQRQVNPQLLPQVQQHLVTMRHSPQRLRCSRHEITNLIKYLSWLEELQEACGSLAASG